MRRRRGANAAAVEGAFEMLEPRLLLSAGGVPAGPVAGLLAVGGTPPVVDSLTASPAQEGGDVNLSCSFTDDDAGDKHTVAIDWGDGQQNYLLLAIGARNFDLAHTYADDPPGTPDEYTISVKVSDGTAFDEQTVAAVVTNVDPTVEITGAPPDSPEGSEIVLGCTVNDPGTADTFTYAWEVTKDGLSYATGSGASLSFTPDDNAVYVALLTVTDDDGGSGQDSTTINVTNVDPTIDSVAITSPIDENDTATLSGTYSDPGTADTHELDIDWDGDGTYDQTVPVSDGTFSVDHQYLDDDPTGTPSDTFDVNVRVRDDDGGQDTGSISLTVNNVAPVIISLSMSPDEIDENDTSTVHGEFTDPGTLDT